MNHDDVIIVGSGPAGAMAARELAAGGLSVRLLEQGGAPPAVVPGLWRLWRRREMLAIAPGVALLRGVRVGGGSSAFFHTAIVPPPGLFARYGVDLAPHVSAVLEEIPHAPLRPELVGAGAAALAAAARQLGLPWAPLPKMIDQTRSQGAHCPPEALWSAAGLLAGAVARGAVLETGTPVRRVRIAAGRAEGVEMADGRFLPAGRVVLAAGGIGTPALLRRSGVAGAGEGFFCDPLRIIMARAPFAPAPGPAQPMAGGIIDPQAGYMLSDIAIPDALFRTFTLGACRPDMLTQARRTMMVMVKIRDDIAGEVRADGSAWRHFSAADKGRMRAGVAQARALLAQAGGGRAFLSPWVAAHPGGSARLGQVLDTRLTCRDVANLHVCDAAALPEPWGLPPTLTVLALARYLAHAVLEPIS
jgi:choline dehydrogenase-like flavoprotein